MNMITTDILIIGAGPVGLFTVFEAGLLNLKCHVIDSLSKVGGQCSELYPEKPIYDIPGVPVQTAQEHIDNLMIQISPFKPTFHLNEQAISLRKDDDYWIVTTNLSKEFKTKNVFIAAGNGMFLPRKPKLDNIEKFENNGVNYFVKNVNYYDNKRVVIFGGGDSAIDWANILSNNAKEIFLIHRTENFRCSPLELEKLKSKSNVKFLLNQEIIELIGDDKLEKIKLSTSEILETNDILFFFGLLPNMGALNEWKFEMSRNKIVVDTEKFQTNHEGIFAVGDINIYPGKLKLILCGFHETTLAVQEAYKRIFPEDEVLLKYTTTNTELQKMLRNNES